jgi:type II secretory pathway component GspD/PulD (secretin)
MLKTPLINKIMSQSILILIAALSFSIMMPSSALAQSNIKVFQTQQHAPTLKATIAPLYANQAVFSTTDNTLIVKASAATLADIEQLLKKIDKPLRNLIIEVASALDRDSYYQYNGIDGRIKTANGTIISHKNPKEDHSGTTVRYGKNGSIISATHTRKRGSLNAPENFTVTTLEGHWAFIKTGQTVPYYTSNYPNNYPYQPSRRHITMDMVDVSSGFEVLPSINADTVTLKIRPQNQSVNRQYPGRINSRSVDTIVSGRLGQWIYLGGLSQKNRTSGSGTLYSTERHSELNGSYKVRVTLLE